MQLICPLISSFRAVLPCSSLLFRRPVWGCTDYITQHSQLHAGLARCKLSWFIAAITRLLSVVWYWVCELALHTTRLWYSMNLWNELFALRMNRNQTESIQYLCLLGFEKVKRASYPNHEKHLSFIDMALICVWSALMYIVYCCRVYWTISLIVLINRNKIPVFAQR